MNFDLLKSEYFIFEVSYQAKYLFLGFTLRVMNVKRNQTLITLRAGGKLFSLVAQWPAKTNFSLARRRTFFSFKIPLHDFHEQNSSFHLNSIKYVAKIGTDVIVIQASLNNENRSFRFRVKFSQNFLNSTPKNIPFYQNAASRFLVNTIMRSIITYFQVANIGIDNI